MKKIVLFIGVVVFFAFAGVAQAEELEWWEGEEVGVFEEEEEVVSNGLVFLEGRELNHDILEITVVISEIQTPVLGMAFHLGYDPSLLSFLRYDPGGFFEGGGNPFYLVSSLRDPLGEESGELVFGETLRRNDSFPIGEGDVAVFYFQELEPSRFDEGEVVYEFGFENGVVSTLDTVRQDIDHIEFVDLVLGPSGGDELAEDDDGNVGLFAANVAGSSGSALERFLAVGSVWIVLVAGLAVAMIVFYFLRKKSGIKICDFH